MAFVDHKITCHKVEELHILNDSDTLVPEVFAIYCKKSSLPSFLPCSSNSSRYSFVICFTLAMAWFLI